MEAVEIKTGVFLVFLIVGVAALLFWKIKLDPEIGCFRIYLVWVLLHIALAAFVFRPWGLFG